MLPVLPVSYYVLLQMQRSIHLHERIEISQGLGFNGIFTKNHRMPKLIAHLYNLMHWCDGLRVAKLVDDHHLFKSNSKFYILHQFIKTHRILLILWRLTSSISFTWGVVVTVRFIITVRFDVLLQWYHV